MLALYVRATNAWGQVWREFREAEDGLTAIEYGVFAAFVVLLLVGAALVIGPQLRTWLTTTVTCIVDRNATGCYRG